MKVKIFVLTASLLKQKKKEKKENLASIKIFKPCDILTILSLTLFFFFYTFIFRCFDCNVLFDISKIISMCKQL